MATITIKDLHTNRALDRAAMSAIKGGNASWVFGWITPYAPESASFGSGVNLYQITNNYYADQMINQFQVVNVNNSGANANVNVAVDERSTNNRYA
jgi:hypothetical protein